MSKNNNFNKIHKKLTNQLKEYINAITEKYGQFIPKEKLTQLKNIKNYNNIIKIYDYKSINALPLLKTSVCHYQRKRH